MYNALYLPDNFEQCELEKTILRPHLRWRSKTMKWLVYAYIYARYLSQLQNFWTMIARR